VSDEQPPKTRIRWLPMILCTLAGAWLIRQTFSIAGESKAEDVKLSFLVEASAALVLLALFFLLERSFTRQVTRTVVRQVQEEVVVPLEQRLAGLSTRIDNLQRNVDEHAEGQRAWHHDLVTAMDDADFDSVAAALADAARLRAIDGGAVRAQANTDPRGIWLDFSYGATFVNSQRNSDNVIRITAYPAGNPHPFSLMFEDWLRGEDVVAVAARIRDKLRQGGYNQLNNRPDWSLALRNVQRALDAVLPDDAPIAGPLRRLVGDLAVTDRGIEHLDGRLLVPVADFPEPPTDRELLGRDETPSPAWSPSRPADIDEAEWEVVTREARRLVGGVRRLHFASPSQEVWIPKGVGYNT
jgi:hypothetical protein